MQRPSLDFSRQHPSLEALRLGHKARIAIPELILRDHRDRGDYLAEVFAPCPMEGGLLDEFRDVWGYAFDWGHVIESAADVQPENHRWTEWNFYIEHTWREATHLDSVFPPIEYSAVDFVVDMYLVELRDALPDYVGLNEGWSYDLFALNTLPNGTQDDRRARHWLATRFVPHILPRKTALVLRHLDEAAREKAAMLGDGHDSSAHPFCIAPQRNE